MMVMHMKAVGEGKHAEMEADYKPAAENISTSCGNNSNARANAWVDDLTCGLQRTMRVTLLEGLRNAAQNRVVLSGSNAQLTTPPAMIDDDDGGWKEASQESWRPKYC
jgi:hypothetical protein